MVYIKFPPTWHWFVRRLVTLDVKRNREIYTGNEFKIIFDLLYYLLLIKLICGHPVTVDKKNTGNSTNIGKLFLVTLKV